MNTVWLLARATVRLTPRSVRRLRTDPSIGVLYILVLIDIVTESPDQSMSACIQFFLLVELVTLFLSQTETPVLVKCQRVCRGWLEIIQKSQDLQEDLYFKPLSETETGEEHLTVTLNPMMSTHFGRIWAVQETSPLSHHQYAAQCTRCNYLDLTTLPWAKDGTHATACARLAFAREEASWRNMLISQPPIRWLDWWHEWESSDRRSREGFPDSPVRRGRGHHQNNAEFVKMGALWDLNEGPAMYQRFNVQEQAWEIHDDLPFKPESKRERRKYEVFDGNGVYWLTAHCRRDNEDGNWRWSRSNAWEGLSLRSITSGMSGSNSQHFRRVRERVMRWAHNNELTD